VAVLGFGRAVPASRKWALAGLDRPTRSFGAREFGCGCKTSRSIALGVKLSVIPDLDDFSPRSAACDGVAETRLDICSAVASGVAMMPVGARVAW